jgi:WD40 repeat protein
MSNMPPFDEDANVSRTPHFLAQRLSRRGFLVGTLVSIVGTGCASSTTKTPVPKPSLLPTTSLLQDGTRESIHTDNARCVKSLATLGSGGGLPLAVAWSPSSTVLAIGGTFDTIHIWDRQTLKQRAALQGHHDQVNRIVWSPDGRLIASASSDGTVRLWDGQRYTAEVVLPGLTGETVALSIAWSPESKRVVAG